MAQTLDLGGLNRPGDVGEVTMHAADGSVFKATEALSAEQRTAELAAARRIADTARERRRQHSKMP